MGPSDYLFMKSTGISFNTGWVQLGAGVVKPAKLSFANTTTESDFFGAQGSGYTVPGNLLEGDSVIRVKFAVQLLNNSGAADNFTFRAYLGATKWFDTGTVSIATATNAHYLTGEIEIALQNAKNAEWAGGFVSFGSAAAATAGLGTPFSAAANEDSIQCSAALSVDLTQNQALRLTGQWGTANANAQANTKSCTIELL
jgi:hypothetical protein